jgi:hypothetical protein
MRNKRSLSPGRLPIKLKAQSILNRNQSWEYVHVQDLVLLYRNWLLLIRETIYDSESAHPENSYRHWNPVGIWWSKMGQLIQKCKHRKLGNEKIVGYLRYLLSYLNLQFGYMNTKPFRLSWFWCKILFYFCLNYLLSTPYYAAFSWQT